MIAAPTDLTPPDLYTISDGDVLRLLMTALPDLNVESIPALMREGKDIGPSWKTTVTLCCTCYATSNHERDWEAQVDDVWGYISARQFSSGDPACALRRAVLDAWCLVERFDDGWVYIDHEGQERPT